MKVTGIIAEYNPFHRGHEYQLAEARRMTGADYIIVVMSGCFTQRGTPAVLDKYDRARMALSCGADLVLELPVRFSCASAEYFASGAVSVLDQLGCVDTLCFGSECGDTGALLAASALLSKAEGTPEYRHKLRDAQRAGLSYPAARELALRGLSDVDPSLLSLPNNILGIEYCRALTSRESGIRPLAILRKGDYHDTRLAETDSLTAEGPSCGKNAAAAVFSSASAVRAALQDGPSADEAFQKLRPSLPSITWQLLFKRQDGRGPITEEDFVLPLRCRLLELLEGPDFSKAPSPLTDFADISKALADKIEKQLYLFSGWQELCRLLHSRDLPHARASRGLCHILLGIRQRDLEESKAQGFPVYLRMLGFSARALPLLSEIKKKGASPLFFRLATARELLPDSLLPLLAEEIRASHIYQAAVSSRYGTPFLNEYQRQIISF